MPTERFDLDTLEFPAVRELLISRLQTALGRRAVESLVPSGDLAVVDRERRVTSELAARMAEEDEPPTRGAVEIRSWLGSFFDGQHQPTTKDVADLMRLLAATARCQGWLSTRPGAPALVQFAGRFPSVADIAGELSHVVDARGEVLDSASAALADIRRGIEEAEQGVRAAVQRFLSDPRVARALQSPEPAWRHGRPVFQVRAEQRNVVRGVLHDRSQSGATLFIEPEVVVEAANDLADAKAAENREIQVVLTQVCRGLRGYREDIERACESMSALDLAYARARLAHDDGFLVAPVSDRGLLCLRDAVHPLLLEPGVTREGPDAPVPLNLTLGDPFSMLVVTGPNTGGKTVALKTVGLLATMALCAIPVPAAEGTCFPLLDGVFADIGDEQGIRQNLSTFSSHVTRIARCLREAGPRSLVLLDELGAGTDPEEGGALGAAVLEDLAKRGVSSVVTTHLGRLKDFAYQNRAAENGAMAFDGETLRPLYRLDVGIPGASHALDIAQRVGMPRQLVGRAREVLGQRDERLEQMIEKVQIARQEAEEQRRRTEKLRQSAQREEAEVQQKSAEIEKKRAWLGEEADALVDEQLQRIRASVLPGLERLAQGPRQQAEEAKKVLKQLEDACRQTSIHRRRMLFAGAIRRDSMVYVPRLGKRCVVKKIDKIKETVGVDVGRMRVEVSFDDLSWIQPLDS